MASDSTRPNHLAAGKDDDVTPLAQESSGAGDGWTTSPPPEPPTEPGPGLSGRGRRRVVGLSPLGAILLLLVIAVLAYLLLPGLSRLLGSGSQATSPPRAIFPTVATPAGPEPPASGESSELTSASTVLITPLSPKELDQELARAKELTLQSEFETAVAVYEDLTGRARDDARPEAAWAWALLLDGQAEQALVHGRRAVELDPIRAEATSVLARAFLAVGDTDRALAMAQSAVELDEASADAHLALAEVYRLDGQFDEAVAEADLVLARAPDSAEAHRIRGWLYLAADDDVEGALRELQAAADLEPELWLRQHELGLILLETGDYDAALLALKNAVALRPKAATLTAIGEGYFRLGQYDRAMAYLEQSLSEEVQDAGTSGLLSLIMAEQGRCDDAQAYILEALAQDSEQSLALEAQEICQGGAPAPTASLTPGEPGLSESGPFASALPPPPPTGTIAFPVWNGQQAAYDTYLARAADGGDRRLVLTEAHQPAFSPGGGWLALNGERDLQENLLIVRPNGSGLQEITEHTEDGLPAWSPDGRSLAFSSTRHGDRQSRIYVIDSVPIGGSKAQGRPLKVGFDDARGHYPAWTAGGQVVYSGCDYSTTPVRCGLLLLSAGPGPQTTSQVTDHPGDTAPAVYGSRIAFMSDREGNWQIYLVNLDGSGLLQLTDSPARDALPTWSPDGSKIAFVSDEGGVWAVWAVDDDGSNRRKLFDIGGSLGPDWPQERISWAP
jgi:beta propeller repeat protein